MLKSKFTHKKLPFSMSHGNVDSIFIEFEPGDRLAQCSLCSATSKSDKDLPLFKERPDKPHDDYFCGCRGWD